MLRSAPRHSRGFSLLEVMVALAVLSVAVVAVFQLFSASLRTARQAGDYTRALFYARSFFDEAYSTGTLEAGSMREEFEDRYRVERQISLAKTEGDEKTKLYEISVSVAWPPSGRLVVTGLRAMAEREKQ